MQAGPGAVASRQERVAVEGDAVGFGEPGREREARQRHGDVVGAPRTGAGHRRCSYRSARCGWASSGTLPVNPARKLPCVRSVAAGVLEILRSAGVEVAFGLPGVHNLAFWGPDAGAVPIVGVRHEQAAGFAADGYARVSGRPGAALVTTGPGAANALAAFGEAAASGSPVVLVASEVATRWRGGGRHRPVLHSSRDQAGMFAPLAKQTFTAEDPSGALEAVAAGLGVAMSPPRGPVYVGIPTDVVSAAAPAGRPEPRVADAPAPDPAAVGELAELVEGSASVVIWAGGGVVQAGAEDVLRRVAELLDAPVVTTFAGRGALPAGHRCAVDAPAHEPEVTRLLAGADLVVVAGSDLAGMDTANFSLPLGRRTAMINCDAAAVDRGYRSELTVVADIGATLEALAARLAGRGPAPGAGRCPAAAVTAAVRDRLASTPLEAEGLRLAEAVGDSVPPDGVVVADMAVAGYWVGGYSRFRRSRCLVYPVGWGTLGFALPAALGAARSGRPTLAVCGDGGLAMAVGELATAVQERLGLVVVVVDDGGYGMLRFDQARTGAAASGVDLVGPDWVALAGAYGVGAERVGPGSDLPGAISRALERAGGCCSPQLVVLDARLRPPRTTSPRWNDPVEPGPDA